jgi:hypothetical protein
LQLTARQWVPALFPHGVIKDGELRVADITGRPPRKQGSCVINLKGEHAGGYTDFGIDNRGHDAVATIADHYRVDGLDALKAAAEIAERYGSYRARHTGSGISAKRSTSYKAAEAVEAAETADHERDERVERNIAEAAFELQRTVPAAGTLVETYFASRGLTLPPAEDLRFGDNCTHRKTNTGKPTLLAVIRKPDGTPTGGIHRIYLKDDGSGTSATN